jgi:outer membrane protein assembly complex protein YaeT
MRKQDVISFLKFSFLLLTTLFMGLTSAIASENRKLDIFELSLTSQAALNKQFPVLEKGSFKKSDLDQAIKFLVNLESFDSVEINEGPVNEFKLIVGKAKRISQLIFLGFHSFSENELRRVFGQLEQSHFDRELLAEAGERVRRFYYEHAYLNASVDLEFVPLSNSEMKITVSITENKQTLISGINIKCENEELRTPLERILRKRNGDPLTEGTMANIRKAAKTYFGDQRYLQSDLQGPQIDFSKDESQAHLLFTIDRADMFKIYFKGNRSYSDSSLEKALDLDNFFSSNPSLGPELATKLKNFYLTNGYARVQVTAEEFPTDNHFTREIRLEMAEGPKVKIEKIEFSGRFTLSSDVYREILIENASELIQKGYYNRDDLDKALKSLVINRQNLGFLKAKYVSSRASYNKERDKISIYINFDEGPMTLVQKIQFEGNVSFDQAQLQDILGLEINRPLRLNALEESIQRLKVFYRNNGYLEMSLLNEKEDLVNYNSDNTLAVLKFDVFEGPKVIVGSILIEGNSLTREYVVRKELDFKLDDVLTPQNLEESVRRLQRLGHFSLVDIRTLEEKTRISRRTVIVRVQDRDPGLFNTGIGLSNERQLTLRGFLGVAYRNISGTGRGISARLDGNYNIADIKYLERKATVGYLEPYLFNSRMRGSVNFIQSNLISNTNEKNGVETRQVVFSVEQDITSHILVAFDLWNKATYRDHAIKDYINESGQQVFENQDLSRVEIASIGPTLDLDFRDHPFNPTKGTFTRLNIEYASPALGSTETIEYVRSIAGFTHYLPVTKSGTWVWANSAKLGYLKNLSGLSNGGVPFDKKGLLLGGQSSIRGFSPGEAFPNSDDFFSVTGIREDPPLLRTEARSYLFKSELRFPIAGNFGGALFYDGGAVYVLNVDFPHPYRDAVGVAARYVTPVGAVSFEWGVKLNRNPDRQEDWQQFHFSIGTF